MNDSTRAGKSGSEYRVTASRVLPARRWQVLRLLTCVEDFARYMPNVKECRVLSRGRFKAVTLWKVEMGEIPIYYKPRTHKEGKTIKVTDMLPAIRMIIKIKFFQR